MQHDVLVCVCVCVCVCVYVCVCVCAYMVILNRIAISISLSIRSIYLAYVCQTHTDRHDEWMCGSENLKQMLVGWRGGVCVGTPKRKIWTFQQPAHCDALLL